MRTALMIMLILLLAGCGAAATPGADPAGSTEPTQAPAGSVATTQPDDAGSEVTAQPDDAGSEATPPAQGAGLPEGSVELAAAEALASQVGIALDDLQLSSKEQQEWSDSSLGCPAPDMMYAQVITPGYKLTFTDGTKTYEVHTDDSGAQAVLCENGQPKSLPGSGGSTGVYE